MAAAGNLPVSIDRIHERFRAAIQSTSCANVALIAEVHAFRKTLAESLQNEPAASELSAIQRAMQFAKEDVSWVTEECKTIQDAIAQKADADAYDMVADDRNIRTGQAAHNIAAEVANWRQIRDIVIGLSLIHI